MQLSEDGWRAVIYSLLSELSSSAQSVSVAECIGDVEGGLPPLGAAKLWFGAFWHRIDL